jgi:hypothetical protein
MLFSELVLMADKRLPAFAPGHAPRKLKIAFGVLSSKHSEDAVTMFAAQVAPHPVYVHHDFSRHAAFAPVGQNIVVLKAPVATTWGHWSLVEASFRLMDVALADPTVTHFQLVSESCMLIRPVKAFETYLQQVQPDLMLDLLDMRDLRAQLSHGWRYFGANLFWRRVLRRATQWCFTGEPKFLATQSINLAVCNTANPRSWRSWVGKALIRLHWVAFQYKLKTWGLETMAVGGQWFGASRAAAQWLLDAREANPPLVGHFQKCFIPDEAFIQTLVVNGQLQQQAFRVMPGNHYVSWVSGGHGPDTLTSQEIPGMLRSGKFFARKVPLETDAPMRGLVLNAAYASPASCKPCPETV